MGTLVKIKGLSTYDNELGSTDGSLDIADNIILDKDNVARPRRGFADYGDAYPCCADRGKQLIFYKKRVIRHFDCTLQFECCDLTGACWTSFSGSYTETEPCLRIKYVEAKGNLYFTTDEGIKKLSGTINCCCETNFPCVVIKDAGAPKALDLTGVVNYTTGGFLCAAKQVAYRVVWGIRDCNCNIQYGTPSGRLVVRNPSSSAGDVNLSFTVPDDVTSNCYFYQVFRTGMTGTSPCVDPGDEMNLVIESQVSTCQRTVGFVAETDVTCECLRASGTPLYTNAITGVGINQSNDKPPMAKDISAFDNRVFYANTQTKQQQTITLLSVCCFVSGTSKFIVGNSTKAREYSFRGAKEVQVITTKSRACTTCDSWLIINSASNERKYVLWNKKAACDVAPTTGNAVCRIPVAVCLTTGGWSNVQVATELACVINNCMNGDFVATRACAVVTITWAKNGNACNTADGTTTTNWGPIAAPSTQGDGGCVCIQDVLLSSLASVGQSIDETARSLVNVINRDPQAIVDAYYLSGACDLPGVILLQSKNISDGTFYLGVTGTIGDNFSPNLPESKAGGAGTFTACSSTITICAHGFAVDDPIYIYGNTITINTCCINVCTETWTKVDHRMSNGQLVQVQSVCTAPTTCPSGLLNAGDFAYVICAAATTFKLSATCGGSAINVTVNGSGNIILRVVDPAEVDTTVKLFGRYYVKTVLGCNTFTISATKGGTVITPTVDSSLRHGTFFKADQISSNEKHPNRVYWSKTDLPEAVPILNYQDVGGKDSEIKRILPLRENIIALKEDGAYLGSRSGDNIYTFDLLDSSAQIIGPDTAVVLNNQIYALTKQGVTTISNTGASVISVRIEDKINEVTGICFCLNKTFGIGSEKDRAYLLFLQTLCSDANATQVYRYYTFNGSWVRWEINATSGGANPRDDKMYINAGNVEYVQKERKNLNRTDYADRQFDVVIQEQDIGGTCFELSSLADVEVGDAIVQTQGVTIAKFNRLLTKLDDDSLLTCSDYSCSEVAPGVCIGNALVNLVLKIDADDKITNTIPAACVSVACNTLTKTNHGLTCGMRVRVTGAGTAMTTSPANLLDDCDIAYVVSATTNTFKLSATSGGSAIDITVVGTGCHVITTLYSTPVTTTFATIKSSWNTLVCQLNTSTGTAFTNYGSITECTEFEVLVTALDCGTNTITTPLAMPFIAGPAVSYRGYLMEIQWSPQDFGDASILKQISEGTILTDQSNYYSMCVDYSSDLSPSFEGRQFISAGNGAYGSAEFGEGTWGGEGSGVPARSILPRQKQRARYISPRVKHRNAREELAVVGISLKPRTLSEKAYRQP